MKALLQAVNCHLLVSSHGGKKASELSGVSLIQALIPFVRTPLSNLGGDLYYPPMAPPPRPHPPLLRATFHHKEPGLSSEYKEDEEMEEKLGVVTATLSDRESCRPGFDTCVP